MPRFRYLHQSRKYRNAHRDEMAIARIPEL
jgi:hypothetical protein